MTRGIIGKALRRAVAVLAAASAAIAAPAAAPVTDGWVADPDGQFLLDVNLKRLTLGDQIRAYQTPQGNCLVFGDFLVALDVPMKVDLGAQRASGWAFREDNRIAIDRQAGTVEVAGKREPMAATDVREVPEGWCIDSAALGRWFGIGLSAQTNMSMLQIESEAKLPVELKAERHDRAKKLHAAAAPADLSGLPQVRLPYRMWRAPALEFVVNAGATYRADGGVKVDRSAAVYAAGELAALSFTASITTNGKGMPDSLWARFYRSDPDGGLLGPLKATHVAFGDVPGRQTALGGGGQNGRGLVVTNRPLANPSSFDRTDFQGELPLGWEAELYRNGSLVAFDGDDDGDGRYHFADVELTYGDNEFEILLYGPQGQVQRITDTIDVGRDNVPPGQLWYWAGVRQPGRKLLELGGGGPDAATRPSRAPEATIEAQVGISERLSVGALVRSMMIEDERVTYVEGAVRHSFGVAMVEAAAAVDQHGRIAGRAQLIAKLGEATVAAGSFLTSGFAGLANDGAAVRRRDRLSVAVPIRLGKERLPVGAEINRSLLADGSRTLEAATSLNARIGRFNLANRTSFTKSTTSDRAVIRNELIGAAHVGRVRLRGGARWAIAPERRFDGADLSANWAAGERGEWEAGVSYDTRRVRGRVSRIHRFDALALAVSGEAASDGSLAAGVSLNFSLDPAHSGFRPTREKLASQGAVRATVYEDLNENGRRDRDEPFARNAVLTTGSRVSERATDDKGQLLVGGLAPYVPLAIGIDQTSLENPALTPAVPVQVLVPRPGVAAAVEIALVGGGTAEGYAVRADGRPVEGIDLELVDAQGRVLGTARTDMDGYFLFERVRYGSYSLRLTKVSAAAIGARQAIPTPVSLNRDRPLARLGAVVLPLLPNIAVAGRDAEEAEPAVTAQTAEAGGPAASGRLFAGGARR